jgi:hypothetical protein
MSLQRFLHLKGAKFDNAIDRELELELQRSRSSLSLRIGCI